MSFEPLVRASSDFGGWDPESIFSGGPSPRDLNPLANERSSFLPLSSVTQNINDDISDVGLVPFREETNYPIPIQEVGSAVLLDNAHDDFEKLSAPSAFSNEDAAQIHEHQESELTLPSHEPLPTGNFAESEKKLHTSAGAQEELNEEEYIAGNNQSIHLSNSDMDPENEISNGDGDNDGDDEEEEEEEGNDDGGLAEVPNEGAFANTEQYPIRSEHDEAMESKSDEDEGEGEEGTDVVKEQEPGESDGSPLETARGEEEEDEDEAAYRMVMERGERHGPNTSMTSATEDVESDEEPIMYHISNHRPPVPARNAVDREEDDSLAQWQLMDDFDQAAEVEAGDEGSTDELPSPEQSRVQEDLIASDENEIDPFDEGDGPSHVWERGSAAVAIQRVARGFLGRRRHAKVLLRAEREKLRSKNKSQSKAKEKEGEQRPPTKAEGERCAPPETSPPSIVRAEGGQDRKQQQEEVDEDEDEVVDVKVVSAKQSRLRQALSAATAQQVSPPKTLRQKEEPKQSTPGKAIPISVKSEPTPDPGLAQALSSRQASSPTPSPDASLTRIPVPSISPALHLVRNLRADLQAIDSILEEDARARLENGEVDLGLDSRLSRATAESRERGDEVEVGVEEGLDDDSLDEGSDVVPELVSVRKPPSKIPQLYPQPQSQSQASANRPPRQLAPSSDVNGTVEKEPSKNRLPGVAMLQELSQSESPADPSKKNVELNARKDKGVTVRQLQKLSEPPPPPPKPSTLPANAGPGVGAGSAIRRQTQLNRFLVNRCR